MRRLLAVTVIALAATAAPAQAHKPFLTIHRAERAMQRHINNGGWDETLLGCKRRTRTRVGCQVLENLEVDVDSEQADSYRMVFRYSVALRHQRIRIY